MAGPRPATNARVPVLASTPVSSGSTPRLGVPQAHTRPLATQQASTPIASTPTATSRLRSAPDNGSSASHNGPDHSSENRRLPKSSYDRSLFKTVSASFVYPVFRGS